METALFLALDGGYTHVQAVSKVGSEHLRAERFSVDLLISITYIYIKYCEGDFHLPLIRNS